MKRRRQRWTADPRAFQRLINRLEPFTAEELMRLELPIRMSFEALRTGKGEASDFHDIVAALNATLVRSEAVAPECVRTALDAHEALQRVWERFERTGKWGFDALGMIAIELGIDLHEQLVRNSSPEQMTQAMLEVLRRAEQQRAEA